MRFADRKISEQRRDERRLAEQRTTKHRIQARKSCIADARNYRVARRFPVRAGFLTDRPAEFGTPVPRNCGLIFLLLPSPAPPPFAQFKKTVDNDGMKKRRVQPSIELTKKDRDYLAEIFSFAEMGIAESFFKEQPSPRGVMPRLRAWP